VSVSYTEGRVTKTASFDITVNRAPAVEPNDGDENGDGNDPDNDSGNGNGNGNTNNGNGGISGDGTIIPPGEVVIPDEKTPLGSFTTDHISYMNGYPDGSFGPDRLITRAEMCAVLFRLLDDANKTMNMDAGFPDVAKDAWYFQPVAYLAQIGIVGGYPDGTFGSGDPITRAEFVTVIARFSAIRSAVGTASSKFPDVAGHWAEMNIIAVEEKGWLSGYPDGTFKPQNNMTRAEAATLINRMLSRGIDAKDIPDWVTVYPDLPPEHWAFADVTEASTGHQHERTENGKEIWTKKRED
jgi:hypothetical protein